MEDGLAVQDRSVGKPLALEFPTLPLDFPAATGGPPAGEKSSGYMPGTRSMEDPSTLMMMWLCFISEAISGYPKAMEEALLRVFAWESHFHHTHQSLMFVERKPSAFGKERHPAEDFKPELMNRNILAELSDFYYYETLMLM